MYVARGYRIRKPPRLPLIQKNKTRNEREERNYDAVRLRTPPQNRSRVHVSFYGGRYTHRDLWHTRELF